MNVVVFIKSLFKGVLYAFIIGMMVWVVLFVVAILFDSKSLEQLIYGWYRFFVLCIICYPLGVLASYHIEKEETTCPRCKKPFSWYEKSTGSETLSESVVSEDVKVDDGNNRYHFERRAFRVGKRRYYYRATCKECGYTQDRTEVGSYKERV